MGDSLQMSLVYGKPNEMAVPISYILLLIDKGIVSSEHGTVFSNLETNSCNSQVGLEEPRRDKTAFIFHHGISRILLIPCGLENAIRTQQQTMFVI